MKCWKCATAVAENNRGRQDTCEKCGAETRCCRNCRHFERSANNECREEQAGRQVEKEKGNFCEWFQPSTGPGGAGGASRQDLKSAADSLFKKS